MKKRFILSLLLSAGILGGFDASAGVVDWCIARLIPEYPYPFEHVESGDLERYRERLHIKILWGTANREDLIEAEKVTAELNRRHNLKEFLREEESKQSE